MNGVINNIIIASATGGRAEFQVETLTYTWNSAAGEFTKQDRLVFPLLSSVIKVSCNIPLRLRLYRSFSARASDLARAPNSAPARNSGLLLEGILGGSDSANQLELAPFCLISGITEVPMIIEKLIPDAVTINLSISLVK